MRTMRQRDAYQLSAHGVLVGSLSIDSKPAGLTQHGNFRLQVCEGGNTAVVLGNRRDVSRWSAAQGLQIDTEFEFFVEGPQLLQAWLAHCQRLQGHGNRGLQV